MKKFYSLIAVAMMATAVNAQVNAFNGADFENWEAFNGSLNSYGLKSYATQGEGKGYNGTNSLNIAGTPTGNDFVFTSTPASGLPSSIAEITFWVKGTAGKSLSINLYKKSTTGYYPFNVGALTADKEVVKSGNNQYTGAINTNGNWVKVTLNTADIANDLNLSDTAKDFFALKVGRDVAYSLDIDEIQVKDASMNVYDLSGNKVIELVGNTVVTNEVSFLKDTKIQIINLSGQVVKSASVKENQSLNVSELPKGVYIVTGVVDGKAVSQKIIKK